MKFFSKKDRSEKDSSRIKKKRSQNTRSALTEKKSGAIADRPEKIRLTPEDRRLIEFEKKNNPEVVEPFVPYYDAEERREEQVINPYYQKISGRYRILKWAALGLLAAFAVSMIFFFRDQITLENFRYLMRNVDFEIDTGIELDNDIVYVADGDNLFTGYRGYLAVVNGTSVTIFDNEGGVACNEEHTYTLPALSVSEKYLLVYDRIGVSCSVYTYFAKEHSHSFDYPISSADMSDSGVYALVTESRDYEGVVYIYNSSFKLMNRVMKNKRISAIDLTDSGDEVLIASYYIDDNGKTLSEITALPTSTSESRLLFTVEDTMVYRCSYLEDGGFVLVCSDGMRFYAPDGKHIGTISYNESGVVRYITDRQGALLVREDEADRTKCILTFYAKDAKESARITVDADFKDIVKDGEGAYVLYADRLERVSPDTTERYTVKDSPRPVRVAAGNGGLFICTDAVAYIPVKEEKDR